MARTLSWISRSDEIRKAVENSVRSHWDRRHLQQLFQLQSRATGKLLASMPTVQGPGKSLLVERSALIAYLEDPGSAKLGTRGKTSRKRPRTLLLRDQAPGSIGEIPSSVTLERGRLEIRFATLEQMVDSLWRVAMAAQDDWDALAGVCDPEEPRLAKKDGQDDMKALWAELRELEAQRA